MLKSVSPVQKYEIEVYFADGTHGIYDLKHLAGRGVFKIWDIDDTFNKVFISPEFNAITWSGDLDIDTINVYCTLKNIDVDEYLKSSLKYASY